jgi:glucosamine kinase
VIYFLGIDGGGSGTRAVIINAQREVVGRGSAGPSSHYSLGPALAAQNCASAAAAAVSDAQRLDPNFRSEHIHSWGFGLAGVKREADQTLMRGFLSEICFKPFVLETDVVAAHAGAFAGRPGIVVSAGTGMIILGADEYGDKFYADGWGPILGDEGGGYWIGVEALRSVCRSLDNRTGPTRLTSPIFDQLGVRDGDEMVRFIYSDACTRDKIASLARVVFELADEGSPDASDIRLHAAQIISRGFKAVARTMVQKRRDRAMNALEGEVLPLEILIALRGGLFEDDFMRATVGFNATEAIVELKRDFYPISSWRVVKPQYDAAVGAAILGQLLV